jgi:hypothetical protein
MGKIFASDINKISSSAFGSAKIDGKTLTGRELKEHVKKMAQGGVTSSSIERKLKESGLSGNQIRKRQSIMSVISGANPITKEQIKKMEAKKRMNVRESRRSSELLGDKQNQAFGISKKRSAFGVGGANSNKSGLGIKRPQVGFAGDFSKNKKIPDKPLPSSGPTGSRPIGF